jgi:peptidoglycan/LPS O-acetylase OafA/YrhL
MNLPFAELAFTRSVSSPEQARLGSIALDQWRGLALVLVLISHGFFFTGRVHGIGRVGVNLFFFISGLLVFRSLSLTRAATHWGRTRSFWWRRFRRLYPALLTYALAMLAVVWRTQRWPNLPAGSDLGSYLKALPVAVIYGTNYYTAHSPLALGHLWSLACEMQFYIIAPVIYALGGSTERPRGVVFGVLLAVLMGLGAAQPVLRRWYPVADEWKYHFEFAVWPMLLGFCCEYKRDWFARLPSWFVTLALWLGAGICGLSMTLMLVGLEMKPLVVATGALLLAPCLLAYLSGRPVPGMAGSWLKWLGERTYSIYLWQQPFTICGFLPTAWHAVGAVTSVAVGGVWFHCFERPFLSASRRVNSATASRRVLWRRAATAAPAVLAGVFLLAGWTLRARYEDHLRAQIWPVTAPTTAVRVSEAEGSRPTLLFLGDSRMAEWGLPRMAHWRVVNAGVGGLTTGQIRLVAAGLLDEFHPSAVVLEGGINDLKLLGLSPEMSATVISLAASNLTAVVEECVVRHIRVVVLEVWSPSRPSLARLPVWNAAIPASVIELNQRLRAVNAPERGVWATDLFDRAGLKPAPEMYRDTMHLKPEVYERLTPALENELETKRR